MIKKYLPFAIIGAILGFSAFCLEKYYNPSSEEFITFLAVETAVLLVIILVVKLIINKNNKKQSL